VRGGVLYGGAVGWYDPYLVPIHILLLPGSHAGIVKLDTRKDAEVFINGSYAALLAS